MQMRVITPVLLQLLLAEEPVREKAFSNIWRVSLSVE